MVWNMYQYHMFRGEKALPQLLHNDFQTNFCLKSEVSTSVGTWDDGMLTDFISLISNFLLQYSGFQKLNGSLMPLRIALHIFWKDKSKWQSLISVWSQKSPVWEYGMMGSW